MAKFYSFFFNVWVVFCSIYIPQSVYWPLEYFHIFIIVNNAAMNIEVHISFQISVLVFFSYIYPGVEMMGHMILISLIFWVSSKLSYTVATQIHISVNSIQESHFLNILTICYCGLFDQSHSDRYEVVSPYGSNLHFFQWLEMLNIFFMCLMEVYLFKFSAHF